MTTPLTTTLSEIRAHSPCRDGWAKLKKHVGDLDDGAPLAVGVVLDSNGLSDTLWVLHNACGDRGRKIAALFGRECVARACDHAERVLPVFEEARPGDDRPRRAIEAARQGDVTACAAAYFAACAAACATTTTAAYAAADAAANAAAAARADAAYAAARAAYAAAAHAAARADADADAAYTARAHEREWQIQRLREMLEGGS